MRYPPIGFMEKYTQAYGLLDWFPSLSCFKITTKTLKSTEDGKITDI